MEMGTKSRKWEGMGTRKSFPHISSLCTVLRSEPGLTHTPIQHLHVARQRAFSHVVACCRPQHDCVNEPLESQSMNASIEFPTMMCLMYRRLPIESGNIASRLSPGN